ncbi:LOW QUALITY PROTEIN: uncharacterized protein Dyak_GE29089 [Drosophila yakuba]|uniref:Uncharacterized protein n=1 Tax=Drosophila yakuba TaxID=7245 RepID=A0A0R1DLN6_DROYA|nr:LOW QUALITY PROTEIN: uncharacterized protein Dyak_GE29089 [Drosophila yakuba]
MAGWLDRWIDGWADERVAWHTLNTSEYQLPKQTQTFGGTQKAVKQQPRRIKEVYSALLVWATSCQTEVTLLLPLPLHLFSCIPHLNPVNLPPVQLHSVSCVGQTNTTFPFTWTCRCIP